MKALDCSAGIGADRIGDAKEANQSAVDPDPDRRGRGAEVRQRSLEVGTGMTQRFGVACRANLDALAVHRCGDAEAGLALEIIRCGQVAGGGREDGAANGVLGAGFDRRGETQDIGPIEIRQ